MNEPNYCLKTIFISLSSIFFITNPATAQLIPDRTLGGESSRVVPDTNIQNRNNIEGGALRGANLFHSFREFNVNFGQEVYFNNPTGVENIINRVTGSNSSNIFGTLGVDGNANLYLINPNGIVFGDGARLDINGTFIGTTADGIRLGTNDVYSATDPASSSLLTIQPGALFINRVRAIKRAIINQGNLGINPESNLTFSADEINNSGSILAPGSNIFLEAINGDINAGNINLDLTNGNGGNLNLVSNGNIFFNDGARIFSVGRLGGNITITSQGNVLANNAFIQTLSQGNVSGEGGNIAVTARSIELNNSVLENVATGNANGGNITINSDSLRSLNGAQIRTNTNISHGGNVNINAQNIELIGANPADNTAGSGIFARSNGTGNGGNLSIVNTDFLRLVDGAQIGTSTDTGGRAGNVNINARNISLSGVNPENRFLNSLIFAFTDGAGNGGNIAINTDSLSIINGAAVSSNTNAIGNAGNVSINARNIELIGINPVDSGFASGIFARTFGTGNAGNIQINTGSLGILDGAAILTNASPGGNSGNIDIQATNIQLNGINSLESFPSRISAQTQGEGSGGDLTVNSDTLSITNGAVISTNANSSGNGGNLTVSARNIEISGVNPNISEFPSRIFAETQGAGKGGDLIVNSDTLRLANGAALSTNTNSIGNGGNLTVNTRNIEVRDVDLADGSVSSIFTETRGAGNSGNLNIINSDSLRVINGAEIYANTNDNAAGNGGNLNISSGSIELIGINSFTGFASGIFTGTDGAGKAGELTITTDTLSIKDGGQISTSTNANSGGDGGNLTVRSRSIEAIDVNPVQETASGIFTRSEGTGNVGNLNVTATANLRLIDGAQIGTSTNATNGGRGGNLTVNAGAIELIGINRFNSLLSSNIFARTEGGGNAGILTIDTNTLSVKDGAGISTDTFAGGQGGILNINATTIELIGINANNDQLASGIFARTQGGGNAGAVTIDTNSLSVKNGAVISTVATNTAAGNSGDITINSRSIELSGESLNQNIPSGIFAATQGSGNAGDLILNTATLSIQNGARISTNADLTADGNAGNLTINASRNIAVTGASPSGNFFSTISAQTSGGGNGGDITINTPDLVVADRAKITATTSTDATGDSGTIRVNAEQIRIQNEGTIEITNQGTGASQEIIINANSLNLDRGTINAESNTSSGGNITFTLEESLTLGNGSTISATAGIFGGAGDGGNITIDTPFIFVLPENNTIAANAGTGTGGNITIDTLAIFGYPQFLAITASSDLGIDGTININGLSDELTRGSLLTPTPAIDAAAIIANDICEFKGDEAALGSSFTIPGKGGIKPNPLETVERSRSSVQWSKRPARQSSIRKTRVSRDRIPQPGKTFEPAVGWYRRSDGAVVLTSNPSEVRPLSEPVDYHPSCHN